MKKSSENYLTIILSSLCMVFLIYIGTTLTKRVKVDFTEEGIYTLSDGTRKVLNSLSSPIKMRLYYSKKAAQKGTEGIRVFNNYYFYVRDLLEEYVANSRNNLSLEVVDPRPDTKDEEDALRYGLKKFHLTETERYFFGLVLTTSSGAEKTIEFFNPEEQETLEYELTKLVYSAMNPQRKKIGVISSLDVVSEELSPYIAQLMRMQGKNPKESWSIVRLLREFYKVEKIEPTVDKIAGVDVLAVIHPKELPEQTLWAIDQFVLGGGKVLLMVDPHSVVDPTRPTSQYDAPKNNSNLKRLMDQWGVELVAGEYAGDKLLAGIGRTNPNMPPQRLLPLMTCDERCTSSYKDAVTSNLDQIVMLLPGVLRAKEVPGTKFTAILSTTDKGNGYRAQPQEIGNPQILWRKFREGSAPVTLGARVVGKFKSAFPNGIQVEEQVEGKKRTKKKQLTGLTESTKESAIVVFSDVDFIHDQFAFKRSFLGVAKANDNSTMFLNAAESLAGNTALMSVRSKGRLNRSFDVIDAIEFQAEKKTADKVKQIQSSIAGFQRELNELSRSANSDNIALVQSEGIRKKRELGKKIAALKGELREVKRMGRERVEVIGKVLQYLNTLLMPALVILLGYFIHRKRRLLQTKAVG